MFVCYHTECVLRSILFPQPPCGDNNKIQHCNYMYYMGSIRLARNTYLHIKQLILMSTALDNKILIYPYKFSSIDFSIHHLEYHIQKHSKKMSLRVSKCL